MPRTAWHVIFSEVVTDKAPSDVEVKAEVPLSTEGQRADLLLLRRTERPAGSGQVLRRLWSLFERVALVEFKSEARPVRRGDVSRLLGYVHQYQAPLAASLQLRQMAAVLVVIDRTPTLGREWRDMGLRRVAIAPGYDRIEGALVPMYVAVLRELVQAAPEQEGLLTTVIANMLSNQAARWLSEHARNVMANLDPPQDGYDEVWARMWATMPPHLLEWAMNQVPPELRLAGLAPEQRLVGLAPEQRLAGLAPELRLAGLDDAHAVLALPLGALRGLSPEYIESLPDDVRAEIKRRLAQP
jgi:hypothetical protein